MICNQSLYMSQVSGQVSGGFGSYQLCAELAKTAAVKYCVLYHRSTSFVFNKHAMTRLGVCVPNPCDKTVLVGHGMTVFNSTADVLVDCGEGQDSGVGFYATVSLLVLLSIIVIVATLVELLGDKRVTTPEKTLRTNSDLRASFGITGRDPRSYLACFDLSANLRGLLVTSEARHFMTPFNGIRAICITWVMLYNSVMLPSLTPGVDNDTDFTGVMSQNILFSFVVGGSYAIDTFFFLSGFLVAHSVFAGQCQHEDLTVRFFVSYILRRVIKVLPLYGSVVAVTMFVVPRMGSGPFWYTLLDFVAPCNQNWWTNFLYINNVYPTLGNEVCLEWTWFLSAEMQFVLVSPVLMCIFKYYYKRVAMILLLVLLVVSFILNASFEGNHGRFTTPWMRFSPFVYGMLADMLSTTLQQYDTEDDTDVGTIHSWIVTLRRWLSYRLVRTIVGTTAILLLLLETVLAWASLSSEISEDKFMTMSSVGGRAQQVFSSFGWGFALLLMFLPLSLGYYAVLQTALSLPIWSIVSRLTLSCYLINPTVVLGLAASATVLPHASAVVGVQTFFGTTCITLFFAIAAHVFIERPIQNVMNILEKR